MSPLLGQFADSRQRKSLCDKSEAVLTVVVEKRHVDADFRQRLERVEVNRGWCDSVGRVLGVFVLLLTTKTQKTK